MFNIKEMQNWLKLEDGGGEGAEEEEFSKKFKEC